MVWARSLHFSTFWRKKTLDCLEPACLISPELLKLKIQLTCTASGLRILNRHSKGYQAIWKPHLIDHMVLPPHFFPCGNGRQYAFKLTTDHRINQTTLLVLLFQVSKCCHHSEISDCGCKGGEVCGRTCEVCALNLKSHCLKKMRVGVGPCRMALLKVKISLNYLEYINYPLRSENRAWLEKQEC